MARPGEVHRFTHSIPAKVACLLGPVVLGFFLVRVAQAQLPSAISSDPKTEFLQRDAEARRAEAEGRWDQALSLRREMVQVLESRFSPENPLADQARVSLVEPLSAFGRYAEAREVLTKSLELRQRLLRPGNPAITDVLIRLGEACRNEGDLKAAEQLYRNAEESLSSTHPLRGALLGLIRNGQAHLDVLGGDKIAAEKKWSEALTLMESVQPPQPARVALVLTSLGEVHRSFRQLDRALKEQQRAAELLAQNAPRLPWRWLVDNNLASVLRDQRRSRQALPLYTNSLQSFLTLRSSNHLEILHVRRNHAMALSMADDSQGALATLTDALNQMDATGLTNHPLYRTLRLDQADARLRQGDLIGSEQLYHSLYQQWALTPDHPQRLDIQERLATLAERRGNLAEAFDQWETVLNRRRNLAQTEPRRTPELTSTLIGYAGLERSLGRFDRAGDRLEEALKLPPAPDVSDPLLLADALEALSTTTAAAYQWTNALRYSEQALRLRREILGATHSLVARSQLQNAELLQAIGNLAAAESFLQQVRAFLQNSDTEDASLRIVADAVEGRWLQASGQWDLAAARLKRALDASETQARYLSTGLLADMAWVDLERHQTNTAVNLATRALTSLETAWENVLRFTPEEDRLAWQESADLLPLLAALGKPELLARAVLHLKGLVLDTTIEERQLVRLETADTSIAALREARKRRYQLELARGSLRPPSPAELDSARRAVEQLESAIARRSSGLRDHRRAFGVTVESVQNALAPDSVLLEYVRYPKRIANRQSQALLGVLVFKPRAAVQWIELGPATGPNSIGHFAQEWQNAMRNPAPPTDSQAITILSNLAQQVWQPVAERLGANNRQIWVAPDGEVNWVPFAALWHRDRFAGETVSFRYLTSGRDLLSESVAPPKTRSMVVLAAPEFDRSKSAKIENRSAWQSFKDFLKIPGLRGSGAAELPTRYDSRPYTALEADQIVAIARKAGLESVTLLRGEQATEQAVTRLNSPFVLHFATHATFLPDAVASPWTARSQPERPHQWLAHPMSRAWIALAHANDTLEGWRAGKPPDPTNDGLLSAEEFASLDLSQTWLVSLSACDTGAGVVRSGEGVFGLRRAVALAGSRHVLMTLWPVSDKPSQELMTVFYKDLFATGQPALSLSQVQQRKLAEWRTAEGPSRAARWAGPFILSSMGK